jgi:predicted alpha/beta-fold hydrolase
MSSPLPFTGLGHEELEAAICKVEKDYPLSDIYLVGASFGGNYLIRYLIDNKNKRSKIKGLVALAPPFNVKQVIDEMPRIYQKFFVRNYLNNTVVRH